MNTIAIWKAKQDDPGMEKEEIAYLLCRIFFEDNEYEDEKNKHIIIIQYYNLSLLLSNAK